MINQLRKIGIVEDAATDNTVVLSSVTSGADGASNFGFTSEEENITIEDEQTVMDRLTHTLDIRTLEGTSTEQSQLDTWTSGQTEVYVSGLGIDGFLLFGDKQTTTELVRLVKVSQYGDRRINRVLATKTAPPGFDASTGLYSGGVWAAQNGLGMYEWGDADSDGVADGWSAAGFSTTSFATGTQTLEADTTQRDFERAIYFPHESEQITFSINNDSRTGSYATEQIEMEFLNASDGVISSSTTTFSATGRKSVTATTPSNTVQVVCRFSIQASSGTVTNTVSDPALRIGTSTTYTKY